MSLLTRRHEPDNHDSRNAHDNGDGVLDEVVDDVYDGDEDEDDGGWWVFIYSRRQMMQLLGVLVVIVVVCAALGTGLYQLFGRPDPDERTDPRETSPAAIARSRQAQESAGASPAPTATATLSAEEQTLREAALSTPRPERPAGMDELSPEGLRLAGEYFLSLYPYVYATGDLSDWQAMSAPECGFCNNVINNVTDMHTAGGWVDPAPQEAVAMTYGVTEEDPDVWGVTFHITHGAGTRHDGTGDTSTVDAENITFLLQMRWTGQTWIAEGGGER